MTTFEVSGFVFHPSRNMPGGASGGDGMQGGKDESGSKRAKQSDVLWKSMLRPNVDPHLRPVGQKRMLKV